MKYQTVHLLLAFLAGMIAYKMLFARTEGFPTPWGLAGDKVERLANRVFYTKECARDQVKC
jgi:hypothetical protein